MAVLAIGVAVLLVAGGAGLVLTGRSPLGGAALNASPTPTGPNTITLTGDLKMAATITPTCRLWGGPHTYWLVATWPESKDKDPFWYRWQLSFWIDNYTGPATYLAKNFAYDKLAVTHTVPDPNGTTTPNIVANYMWADLNGVVTIKGDGLSGSITQNLMTMGTTSPSRAQMTASWECTNWGELPLKIN